MGKTIHIFCLVGKIKCGKKRYLNSLLSEHKFLDKENLKPLICGTTRSKRENEIEGKEFYFITSDEYNNLDKSKLIESRSYYTIREGEVYYFTKPEDFLVGSNLVCIATPYQYENYKSWIDKQNIIQKDRFKLHLIYIDSDVKQRIYRMYSDINSEDELCELARRIIQDKNEFESASQRIPELIDPLLYNVCYINDSDYSSNDDSILTKIKRYIHTESNFYNK